MVETWSASHDLVIVEAGDAFSKGPTVPEPTRAAQELKATLQVRSLVADGLDAFVPGPGDLALGAEFLQRMITQHQLPVLAGNLRCGDQGYPATRVVEAGGRRIGLIGVVGQGLKACEVTDPAQALTAGLAALDGVDLRVLLFNGERADVAPLVAGVSGLDFVVSGGAGQSLKNPKKHADGPWQLAVGSRGKKLGVMALTWNEGAAGWVGQGEVDALATRLDRYRERVDDMARRSADAPDDAARRRAQEQRNHYQLEVTRLEGELAQAVAAAEGGTTHRFTHSQIELDDTVADHARVAPWMVETQDAINGLAASDSQDAPAYGGPFVGSGRCSGCHAAEYRQWKTTDHASAWPTLVDAGRQGDPDCVSCHATGHWHPQGPSGVAVETHLRGVGCEDCHGPGREHAESPVTHDLAAGSDPETCVRCHDGVRDDGQFALDSYLPKVVHGPR